MLTFIQSLLVSLIICALCSFGVFFAKRFQTFVISSFCFLLGVVFLLLKTDSFAGLKEGCFAAVSVFFVFMLEFLSYCFIKKKNSLFYGLPFLAFISLGIAQDLPTVLLGLMLFGLSFVSLCRFKGKNNTQDVFLKVNAGLLSFSYGIAIIFSRIGVLKLSDVHLQISIRSDDEWLMFGLGLLCLGVVIELYAIFLSLRKVKK